MKAELVEPIVEKNVVLTMTVSEARELRNLLGGTPLVELIRICPYKINTLPFNEIVDVLDKIIKDKRIEYK